MNGRKVIEVTKQFHEISMSDSESELNTTNEDVPTDDVRYVLSMRTFLQRRREVGFVNEDFLTKTT